MSEDPTKMDHRRELLATLLHERGRGAPRLHTLSHGQRALWLLDRFSPGDTSQHIAFAFSGRGEVDFDALRRAFTTLVARHGSLRTTFELQERAPVQRVSTEGSVDLAEVDAPTLTSDGLHAMLRAETRRAFDLKHGPLVRARLIHTAPSMHVLLLVVHHLICDGWSIWILLDELRQCYLSEIIGAKPALPAQPRTYLDFVRWQAAMLESATGEGHREYWRDELAGVSTILELPRSACIGQSGAASIPAALDEPLSNAVRRFAQRTGTTPYMVLLAAFQVLLSRLTGQFDFLVGSPFLGRPQGEFDGVIGFFANVLPLRADLREDVSFERFLVEQVRARVLGAIEHQDFPFPSLVQLVGGPRELDRSPLVQVMFAFQKPQRKLDGGSLLLEPIPILQREGPFDLVLELADGQDVLRGTWKYRTDRVDTELVEQLSSTLGTVLRAALDAPESGVRAIPLLDRRERAIVLDDWAPGPVIASTGRTVSDMFLAQARATPQAVALASDGREMQYRQLLRSVLDLASRLRDRGIGPESRVAVLAERSFELIVGALAVLEAGGIYIPLDPSYPPARLESLFRDANPDLTLAQPQLADRITGPTMALSLEGRPIEQAPGNRRPAPHDAAYCIYTSGSTGRPNGVVIEHRSLANLVEALAEVFQVAEGTRVLQFASPCFDASISEIFVTLCHGGTLCLPPPGSILAGPELVRWVERERISLIKLPPSVWATLPQAPLPDLRTAMAGGEICSVEIVSRWAPGRRFINVYGPTEATVCAAVGPCIPDESPVSVGRPIAGLRAYVLDAGGELAPAGVPGELIISGAGVARGYWNRPEKTAERFLPDRFAPGSDIRMYRTGDRARWLRDGRLEILGRVDRQLKVRGHRVEPGEIEVALRKHPAIAEAVASALPDGPSSRLGGWYVLRPGSSASGTELHRHLSELLPSWMVPVSLIEVAAMPRTPHGKLDLRRLSSLARPSGRRREPVGGTERLIVEIWKEILKVDSLDPDRTFLEQGGDSLLLVAVHMRLQETLDREIPAAALFRHPTSESLAAWLDGDARDATEDGRARAAARLSHRPIQSDTSLARIGHRRSLGSGENDA